MRDMIKYKKYQKKWEETHPEWKKNYNKKYRENNREKVLAIHLKSQRKRRKEVRQQVLDLVSNQCYYCNSKEKLELHHLYYAKDSVRPNGDQWPRYQEVIAHPERFQVLCKFCHMVISWIQKDSVNWHKLAKIALKEHIDPKRDYLILTQKQECRFQ